MHESDLQNEFQARLLHFASQTDRAPALRCERDYSYADLLESITDWGDVLSGYQCIALQLPNGFSWASLDLALLFSNRVSVPIPEFFSEAQRDHVLSSCGADCLITTEAAPGRSLVPMHQGVYLQRLGPENPVSLHVGTSKVTFTSGSTGSPKGVCLDARTMLQTARGITQALAPLDIERHLSVLPLSLLLENVAGLYANLWNGSTITLLPLEELGLSGSSSMDALAFAAAQARHQPQSMITVPQQLLALTALAEAGVPLSEQYRFIAVGGARVAPTLLQRARARSLPAYEGYGLSECGSVIALNTPANDRAGAVGVPLVDVVLSVIDGEVVVEQPKMLGYVNGPAQSMPVCTGDTGHLVDDFLCLEGRIDNRIITSFGRNLAPEWVESELQAEIPIALACVFGDQAPCNVALIVPRDNATETTVAESVERCNARLPDYARVSRFSLMSREALSAAGCLSPLGKLRRSRVTAAFGRDLDELFGAGPVSLPASSVA